MIGGTLVELLGPMVGDPANTVLAFDFDGTLSPTVTDPATARPAPGVEAALSRLVGAYRTVAVVSGRPLSFLVPLVPAGVVLSGQYGLERRDRDGVLHRHPGASATTVGEAAAALLGAGVDPTAVEAKGLTLTVHFRRDPRTEGSVRAAAAEVARRFGLVCHDAKKSVELRPPVESDKGTVLVELAQGAGCVLYVGDDIGDLAAFDALERLRAAGAVTLAVAVRGPELPDALARRADVTVAGTAGVVDLLGVLCGPS